MEISIDIFLSIEDIDDILLLFSKTSVENFINTLHLFPKCRWKFPVDILLPSLNQNRICKVFSQIFRVLNLQKNEQFTSGKNIVF